MRAWLDSTSQHDTRVQLYGELMTTIEASKAADKAAWALLGLSERAEDRL
jgi:hypothetical protein